MTYYVNKCGEKLIYKGSKDLFKGEILSLLSMSQHHVLPYYVTGKQEQDEVWKITASVEVKIFKLFFLTSCYSESVISC